MNAQYACAIADSALGRGVVCYTTFDSYDKEVWIHLNYPEFSVTFVMLKKLSQAFGTDNINVAHESETVYSELTVDPASSWIQLLDVTVPLVEHSCRTECSGG